MTDKANAKPLSKIQEMRRKVMKQKEDTINTVLTTAKNNPTFIKLLMFTLNSLENFVSPPNREIRINASVIIRLEGVGILHKITIKNIKNDEIVSKAGDIIWKLIGVYNIIDHELAKLFAEKNGHKAVIEILLERKTGDVTVPYVRVLNGLVQIPQLVPTLIESGIANTMNLDDEKDLEKITLNLDTLKNISNQKAGRDFLITKNFVEKIIKNINICADKKSADSVLCGLAVLDNLCRNEEGKKAVKDAGGIECLSHVLDMLGTDDFILKMCAKIYSKIANADDMKAQLEKLKEYLDTITTKGPDALNFQDVNKSLVLVSNFMLVDELGKQLQNVENFKVLESLFNEIQKIDLNGKDNNFVNVFTLINRYFMLIFYRLFALQPAVYNKQTDAGKQEAPLLKNIQDSIKKNWEGVKNVNNKDTLGTFAQYFTSYAEILGQKQKVMKENNEVDEDFNDVLLYIDNNILANGQNTFTNEDLNSHKVASNILKITDELGIHNDKQTKKAEFLKSLVNCYPYLEYLFTTKEDDEILCNSLEVIYDLLNNEKEFFNKNIEQIIFKICDFMNKKSNHRFPCLQCMKLLDLYLTPDYVAGYIKSRDPSKVPTHSIDFVECTVNVMVHKPQNVNYEKIDKSSILVEQQISEIGGILLEKLIDELEFKTLLKEFCANAESFEPDARNKDAASALEKLTKKMFGVMNVKKYFELGSMDILQALKHLIEKEVKFVEFYKRDKNNQKSENYAKTLEEISSRVFIELALDLKLCYVSQQNLKYIQHGKALDILFLFLSKSTDNENIKMLLYFFKGIFKFLLDNERNIQLETKEYITEKLTNINTGILRKLIEEEDVVGVIIDSLTMLAEARKHLCNTMVKAGLPRLLFQVMETSPNEENVEKALYLLKIISFSNLDNLTMVANQNALIKFFDTKNKYPSNQKIIDGCDLISNEILAKIPNQEQYLDELIKDAVKQFNENAKNDFATPEVKQKLLNNLEVINSFSTNKTQFENLSKETEFITNLKSVSDKTFAETNVTNVIEKLLNNELAILKKLNTVDDFEHAFTIDKLINVIKNKGGYRDVLLSATEEFIKYLKDDDLYDKFLKEKVDNSFIDAVFDNIENYLGDIKVSKDLNNILCYLCLRDEKLAAYIKSKGGLANVLEELKANVNSNDKNSQQMKLNALKMLNSLCKDKEGMDMFVKANGLDLINKILEVEAEMYEDYKPNDKDLYKTREPLNLPIETKKVEEEENVTESYVVYCAKLIQNAIEQGNADFNNPKSIKNLLVISEAEYPKKEVFVEICNLYNKVNYQLPAEEKYIHFLIKQCLSYKGKYFVNENFVNDIDKTSEKVLPKLKDNNAYLDEIKKSVADNKNDQLQLTYLGSYVSLNDNFAASYASILDALAQFANDFFAYYIEKAVSKTREDVPEGVIISLVDLLLYLLKNKKETVLPKIDQIIDSIIFLGEQYANRRGHFAFSILYLTKLAQIFDIIGKRTNENKLNVLYKKYLDSVVPRAVPVFGLADRYLKEANNDYSKLAKNLVGLYEVNSKNIDDYFSCPNSANQEFKSEELVNNILDLLEDLQNATGIEPEKLNDQYETLFSILNGLLSQVDNKKLYVSNDQTLLKILSAMKSTKEKGFPDKNGIFEKIMNNLAKNLENSSEIFEKITDFIGEDLKATPQKEVDINLDTLANQTKYSTAVKCLLNNKELTKNIHELYKAEDLPVQRRKNISQIYSNLMKNTYNVDTILEEDPDTFKTIAEKLSKKENVIKEKENIIIPKNELGIIVSVLKDNNSYKQVLSKKLISDADVKNMLENYKGVDPSLEELLKELKAIHDRMQNKDLELQKSANFKVDFAILNNLKKRIEQAFNEHIDAVSKLNPLFEAEEAKPLETGEKPKLTKQLGFVRKITTAPAGENVAQVASSIKKRRLSVISAHLFYNPFNTQLASPISTKNKDDIATALDSLLALIRLLYSNHKDSSDTTIKEQRQHLLQEAIKTLKMLSICPDNHKPICELGLLNFMERLISDNREENFAIYLGCLDILKNCTWSESAVLLLLESSVLDKLIEEILNFYNKPELLTQSDELRSCFLYENILFSNICKCNKGFEAFFNKIGMEKLIVLGKNTGNIDFLTAIVEMLTNYLLVKKPEFTDEQLNDILTICNKGLTLPDKSQNLLAKTLGLTGFIYDDKSKEKINNMNIVKVINDTWDEFKDDPEYFHNVILLLGTVCLDNKKYSDEVVDTALLDKIIAKLMTIEQNDELIINYSTFLKNLVEKNEDNRSKMCKEEVFNNILHFIDTYSPKIVARRRGFSISGTLLPSGTVSSRSSMSLDAGYAPPKREESYNIILNNLLRVLDLLTLGDKCVEFITKNRFMGAIIDTIGKPACDIKVVISSLQCLANYFFKDTKSKWKHYEIEQLYSILKLLQKEFYANGEVLSKINYIAGYILKGYKSKLYSERYYLLALEGLNCQDWNVDLVILTLQILKEALEDHEDLHNDIFEQTKQSILNILRVYQNNLEIQKLCYEILTIFAHNKVFSFNIVLKTDVMEIVRDTLNNQDFNSDTEKRLVIRIAVFNLLNYLVYDDSTSLKVAYELMESFIKDLLSPNFTEDLTSISGLLANLFRTKQSIEPFYQYSGQEALCLCLEKFYGEKKFILNCFKMIKEICFGGEENKKKLREIKVEDKIKVAMEKCKPEDRIIKFEGKITITNINFEPGASKKPYSEPNYDEIHCIELTKRAVYNFVTNGVQVKALNPKGKLKEFILCFAPDLMKVYLKKPKLFLIPPKVKYTLEVPSTVLVRGHGTDAFKKNSKLFSKPPDPKLCFSIIMKNANGSDAKSLNVVCSNDKECEKIAECVEVALYYAKTRCGKAEAGNLFPHLKFLNSLEEDKPRKLFGKK